MGQKLAVRSRIGNQLFFVEALRVIQRLLGSETKDLVRFPLQHGQIEKSRCALRAVLGNNPGDHCIPSVTGSG